MSIARGLMTMRTVVQRNTAATDEWGQPGAPGWSDHATDVACFATATSSEEVVGGASFDDNPRQIVALRTIRVIVPETTDVVESDRLGPITDRQGAVLFPGPFDIKSVDRFPRSHIDLLVRAAA